MPRLRLIAAAVVLGALAACGGSSSSVNEPADAVSPGAEEAPSTPASTPPVAFGDHQIGRVCRAAIGAIMARDPANIRVDSVSDGIAQVSYARFEDGKVWKNRCRIEGDRVIWGTIDAHGPDAGYGRWHDGPADEVVTFQIIEPNVLISQAYKSGPLESAYQID